MELPHRSRFAAETTIVQREARRALRRRFGQVAARRRSESQSLRRRFRLHCLPMELTFTHRILYCADSSNLPELLMGMESMSFPEGDLKWPPLPLRDARRA